jgi:hypothetical protein
MQTYIYVKNICFVVQNNPCIGVAVYVTRNMGNFKNKQLRMC